MKKNKKLYVVISTATFITLISAFCLTKILIEYPIINEYLVRIFIKYPTINEYTDGRIYEKIDSSLVDTRQGIRENYNAYKLYPLTKPQTNYTKKTHIILTKGYILRDNPAVHIDKIVDWSPDTQDVNWHFKINSWAMISVFFNAHENTGDLANLRTIKPVVFDWINANIVDDIDNKMKWYDMATGTRAVLLAYFFNYYPLNELSDTEYFNLLVASSMHVEVLANPDLLSTGNHGIFQMVGIKALCTSIPEIIQCNEAGTYADRSLENIIAGQFTTEGIHKEHSSQYHPWAIEVIEGVLATGLFPRMNMDNLELAKNNIPWIFYPNGRSIQLGDSDQRDYNRYEYLTGKAMTQPLKAFIKSGYSFYRQSWSDPESAYLAFTATYHSRTHKQSDDLSFVWYDLGQEIFTDSGKYSYSNGAWRDYFLSTRSHNTIEIDGTSNKTNKKYEYGSAIEGSRLVEGAYVTTAELDRKQFNTLHKRQLVLFPGELLLVIDMLSSPDGHTYKQWFHLSQKFVQLPGQKFFNKETNQHLSFQTTASTALTLDYVRGVKEPEIGGWVSTKYQQRSPRGSLSISTKAKSTTMITAFSLAGDFKLSFDKKSIVICSQNTHSAKNVAISLDDNLSLSLDRNCIYSHHARRLPLVGQGFVVEW